MPRLARVEIWSDLVCNGGTRVAFVPDPAAVNTTRDVTDIESVTLSVPRDSAAVADLLPNRILRLVRRDLAGTETFDEWRIGNLQDASGDNSSLFTYTALSILDDLAWADVVLINSFGEPLHVLTLSGLTPTQVLDSYVIPSLVNAGRTYFSRGTVDPTAGVSSLDSNWTSVLSLLQSLRDATKAELRVRRNGTTGYFIDLVNQIGAGATMPTFRLRKNLRGTQRTRKTDDLVTRCSPRGGQIPALTEYHTLARVQLKVTAIAGSTVTVVDPAGVVTPIAYDDEYNTWWVMRLKTGGTFQVNDTIAGTQQLVLASLGSMVVGELLELRRSDAKTERMATPRLSPILAAGPASAPYAVASSGARWQIADIAGGADWVTRDGQYDDFTAVFCSEEGSFANTNVNGPAGRFEFAVPITGKVQIGDLILYTNGGSGSPPWGVASLSLIWLVTNVDFVNNYAYVQPLYANRTDALPNAGLKTARIYRPYLSAPIVNTYQATDQIEFASLPAAAVTDLVLLEQRSAGVFPSYVQDPVASQAPPTGYGIVGRSLDRPALRGEGNVVLNPRLATWSNAVNPPDGWNGVALSGAYSAQFSKNTNPSFIRYGVNSWFVTLMDHTPAKATKATSPVFYINPVQFSGLGTGALKLSIYLDSFANSASFSVKLRTVAGASLNLATFFSTDFPGAPADFVKAAGQWYDFTFSGISFVQWAGTEVRGDGGFYLELTGTDAAAGPVTKLYIDSLAVYQIAHDPGGGSYIEGSYANKLLDEAHKQLASYARPQIEYNVRILDVERLPTTPWPEDALTLGGQVDFRDPDLGIVDTPRLVRMEIDEFAPDNTQLTLATQQRGLTSLLVQG